jgi:BirA family biotin operon repressor/biotin-[acetyl-CoA-carboxylase] ligase
MTRTAISPLFAISTLDSTVVHSDSVEMDERTRAALETQTRFRQVRWVEETGSTNDDLRALAEAGEAEGLVLVTDHQTAGRGRLDRVWEARPGDGLLVSVLFRPDLAPPRWGLVSSAVALAAADACASVAGVEPEIKWPNDLLAPAGPKLAGILAVGAGSAVVVGMGLNVHGSPPGAACLDELAGRVVSRSALLDAWLRSLDRRAGDWDQVARSYRRRCATVGRRVAVELAGGRSLEGVAEDLDEAGCLVVRSGDGSVVSLSVGDVTHLR